MKTNIINTTLLAVFVTSGFIFFSHKKISRNLVDRKEISSVCLAAPETTESTDILYVKAKILDGELMPVVDLPEFNVISGYNDALKVKAKLVDGEIIPVVDLPELTIEG